VSTNVTLHAGHDVAYFTSGRGRGGCAGAMSYYTAAGEPPGQWAGKAAAGLGLSGLWRMTWWAGCLSRSRKRRAGLAD
jgi:TrwC relaxase